MFDQFLTPEYAPFAVSFVVMIGIGLIEAVGLGLGHFDLHPDLDHPEAPGVLDWLGAGSGMPILIWLTSLLACFTLSGLAVQGVAEALLGAPLHWGLATGGSAAVALMFNSVVARGLARVLPGDETTVIDTDELLMRRGVVLEGVARRGQPARAKVIDQHGQAHYVMIEPHHDEDLVSQGETAMLVRRQGALFFALPDAATSLRSL